MNGTTLAETLRRLHSCQEAADLIYSTNAPHQLGETTAATKASLSSLEDFSIVVARRIGTAVARLNDLVSPTSQVVLTPRLVLCELMDIVRQALYASLPLEMRHGVALADKENVIRQFSSYVSTRQVPLEAAAEGLHTVSYVSVKLRVELVALQLRRRLQEELQKKDVQASESSVAALVVTETLLEDFMTIYNNIVLTLPMSKAVGLNASGATEAAERLVPVITQYYYRLCDWVLVLESTMQGPVTSYTQVKRLSVDERKGAVVVDLHRPTAKTAWGLLLNEQGHLVDIDVSLRVFDRARQLHDLLQAAPQGAVITKINDHAVPPVKQNNYTAYAQSVMETLQSVAGARRNLQLSLQSPAFKEAARTMPTEVTFVAPPQGGEGTSGQRVTLVLRRQSLSLDWGFTVDERLYWQPPSLRILSEPAKAFVKAYGRHLRLLAVNGVEALHPTQVTLLLTAAETVVLELLVMPTFTESRRARAVSPAAAATGPQSGHARASAATSTSVESTRGNSERLASGKRTTAPSQVPQSVSQAAASVVDTAKLDAAVNSFLNAHADTSANVTVDMVETTVAMETPLVDAVAVRPVSTAAAAASLLDRDSQSALPDAAVAEAPKKRRGRPPRKAPEMDGKAEPVPTAPPAPEVEATPSMETEKPKAKRGRSRKVVSAAPVSENAIPTNAIDPSPAKESTEAASQPAPFSPPADKEVMSLNNTDTTNESPPLSAASVPADSAETAEAPFVFDNAVKLLRLSDNEMVLERPSTTMPWGLPIGRISNTATTPQQLSLRLMSLPPAKKAAANKNHPFLTHFRKHSSTWFISEVNGKPAANADTTLRTISKLTRLTLRFVRK